MLSAYLWASNIFRSLESGLLVGSLFAIICLTVIQIILRNFFGFSLSWVEPLNQHLVLVIAFLGAMVAGRKGEHITFDIAQHYLPTRYAKVFSVLGCSLSAIVCLYLAFICANLTYLDFVDPIPAFSSVPQWVFELFIPLGFAVIGYRLLRVSITGLYNREPASASAMENYAHEPHAQDDAQKRPPTA